MKDIQTVSPQGARLAARRYIPSISIRLHGTAFYVLRFYQPRIIDYVHTAHTWKTTILNCIDITLKVL